MSDVDNACSWYVIIIIVKLVTPSIHPPVVVVNTLTHLLLYIHSSNNNQVSQVATRGDVTRSTHHHWWRVSRDDADSRSSFHVDSSDSVDGWLVSHWLCEWVSEWVRVEKSSSIKKSDGIYITRADVTKLRATSSVHVIADVDVPGQRSFFPRAGYLTQLDVHQVSMWVSEREREASWVVVVFLVHRFIHSLA